MIASHARNHTLAEPGGFPAERTRQLASLHEMADVVEADEPDLEMQRLRYEDDLEGRLRLLRQRLRSQSSEAEGEGSIE